VNSYALKLRVKEGMPGHTGVVHDFAIDALCAKHAIEAIGPSFDVLECRQDYGVSQGPNECGPVCGEKYRR
jgi:hypothetical protein